VLDGADLPGLKIRGASLRGDEHRYYSVTRQDSMGIRRVTDGTTEAYLVCVADGVGSERQSQRGSAEACHLLYDEVGRRVTALFSADPGRGLRVLGQDMMERVAERLTDVAHAWGVTPKVISTTLVGALLEAHPEHPERRRCVALGIGDSGAFLLRQGIFHPLFPDEHDTEITSTNTSALPTSPGQAVVIAAEMVPGDVLMVCTDGLSNPMRSDEVRKQLARWWGTGAPGLPEFGWQLSFRIRSYGDDRTAVCVWGL
jgi:serine/threonine protein phosphatase PrpC